MRGRGGRRARRPAAVFALLLFGATAVGLALALYFHLGGVPGFLVTFLPGLPGLYAGWVALRDTGRPRNLTEIADGLADGLRAQWARESEARGLNDPYPLPVAWTAADPPLAGDLDALKTLAASGAGWLVSAREHWAEGPEDLAGGGDRKLADVLAAVPTGRLVVLGEPGSGKTMLMVGLVLDLLHPSRRRSGGAVPVLASLASWDPVSQDLHGWLGATLITGYRDLARVPPPGSVGNNRFEALLEAGLILPVLDGLDEISESVRAVAIARINKELRPGEQVVIACRTEQYRAAVCPQHGQGVALRAAVVQLGTLEFGEVAQYLRRDAGPAAAGRWHFLDALSPGSPARQALATPLMAGLARVIYNPRPGELAGTLRDPAELCDPARADRTAVESLLFDAFVPAAYRNDPADRSKALDAERWLVFLARHLESTIASPDLAWWQLPLAAPGFARAIGVAVGVVVGAAAGVAVGVVAGYGPGSVAGAAFATGAVAGVKAVRRQAKPVRRIRMQPPSRGDVVYGALAGGVLAAVLAATGAGTGIVTWAWVVIGAVAGFASWSGRQAGALDLSSAASPHAVLAGDRTTGIVFGAAFGLVAGLLAGVLTGVLAAGAVVGTGAAVVSSFALAAWPSYGMARIWLAARYQLPWQLMGFLADAHKRGVLRQAGAVYQFRHINLQHRLATRPEQDLA